MKTWLFRNVWTNDERTPLHQLVRAPESAQLRQTSRTHGQRVAFAPWSCTSRVSSGTTRVVLAPTRIPIRCISTFLEGFRHRPCRVCPLRNVFAHYGTCPTRELVTCNREIHVYATGCVENDYIDIFILLVLYSCTVNYNSRRNYKMNYVLLKNDGNPISLQEYT